MSTDQIYSNVEVALQQVSSKQPTGDPKPSCELALEVQTARFNPHTLVLVACCVLLACVVITLGVLNSRCDYDALYAKYRDLEILSNFTERNLTDSRCDYDALFAKYRELEMLSNFTTNLTENVNKLQNNLLDANRSLESCKGELLNKLCPVGWNYSNGKCYYFSNYLMNWNQSRDKCVSMGGHLTIIETAAEQKFLSEVLPNKFGHLDKIWIGLSDSLTEGLWLWVDNTKLNASNIFWGTNTNGKEPDNWMGVNNNHPTREDCVQLGIDNNNIAWYDAFCEDSFKSICETRGFN